MEEKNHAQEGNVEVTIGEVDVVTSPKESKKDVFLPISIIAAALMVTGAIVFSTLYKGGSAAAGPAAPTEGNNPAPAAQATTTAPSPAQAMALGPRDALLGNPNAKVTLIEYGDYQCPYCAQFFSQTESQIVRDYVNTGKVRMVFRDFAFLGAESTAAAGAAQCAEDQGKLWPYHDALYAAKYADFQGGGGEDDGFYSRAEFLKLAQQVGLDTKAFASCIDANTDARIVTQERADAASVGVNSTPSFILNGQMISGAQPYSVFQNAIDAALKAAK